MKHNLKMYNFLERLVDLFLKSSRQSKISRIKFLSSNLIFSINLESRNKSIWDDLGVPTRGMALLTSIEDGFCYEVFSKVSTLLKVNKSTLASSLAISLTTLSRRAKKGRLNSNESDKLYRVITVFSRALDFFEGDEQATILWIQSNIKNLDGKSPLDMVSTSAACDALMGLIERHEF